MPVIIDSSALLAALLAETGADIVALALGDAAISTVNIAECVEVLARRGLDTAALHDVLTLPTIRAMPLSLDIAITAGELAPLTRSAGLSLGDRCCLALARSLGARVLTADRMWAQFGAPLGIDIQVIR